MKTLGERAVVLGGSIAGLLAARALADAYTEVVIVERDELPAGRTHRRGVPQGRHIHALLARGQSAIEELLPGLTAELTASGVPAGDMLADTRLYFSGHRFRAAPSGLPILCASRPQLEAAIRSRVLALPGVTVLDRCDVSGLATASGRVTGARVIRRMDGAAEETVPADLVVDATGRGSRTPSWLEALGHPRPSTDEVRLGVCYTSRTYRLRPGALDGELAIIAGATPDHPRGAALQATEDGEHLLTLYGVLGDRPPTDPAGFEDFAAGLRFPDVHRALQGAEPVTEPVAYRFPASVRHRYTHLPDGLLVIGDAVCSFNPIYGQGMSVAALEALALHRHLAKGAPRPRTYQRAVNRIIDPAWTMATKADLAYQDGWSPSLIERYITRIHAGAAQNPDLGRAFLRVSGLVDPPTALLRPTTAARALRHGARETPESPLAAHAGPS
ncbi:FAD-dependent oxidoreductase [Actinomadura welshii]